MLDGHPEDSATLALTQATEFFPVKLGPELFSLELAIEHTRALGNRVFAKQILIVVPPEQVFSCPGCHRPVCDIRAGQLDYCCDVSSPDDPEFQFIATRLLVANLLSEHECKHPETESEQVQ